MQLVLMMNMKDITAYHETNDGDNEPDDGLDANGILNRLSPT